MTTERELLEEIERLKAQLHIKSPVLIRIGGKAQKIRGRRGIGKGSYQNRGGKTVWIPPIPVVIVEDAE